MQMFSLVVMKYSASGCLDVEQFHGSQELSRKKVSVHNLLPVYTILCHKLKVYQWSFTSLLTVRSLATKSTWLANHPIFHICSLLKSVLNSAGAAHCCQTHCNSLILLRSTTTLGSLYHVLLLKLISNHIIVCEVCKQHSLKTILHL